MFTMSIETVEAVDEARSVQLFWGVIGSLSEIRRKIFEHTKVPNFQYIVIFSVIFRTDKIVLCYV